MSSGVQEEGPGCLYTKTRIPLGIGCGKGAQDAVEQSAKLTCKGVRCKPGLNHLIL